MGYTSKIEDTAKETEPKATEKTSNGPDAFLSIRGTESLPTISKTELGGMTNIASAFVPGLSKIPHFDKIEAHIDEMNVHTDHFDRSVGRDIYNTNLTTTSLRAGFGSAFMRTEYRDENDTSVTKGFFDVGYVNQDVRGLGVNANLFNNASMFNRNSQLSPNDNTITLGARHFHSFDMKEGALLWTSAAGLSEDGDFAASTALTRVTQWGDNNQWNVMYGAQASLSEGSPQIGAGIAMGRVFDIKEGEIKGRFYAAANGYYDTQAFGLNAQTGIEAYHPKSGMSGMFEFAAEHYDGDTSLEGRLGVFKDFASPIGPDIRAGVMVEHNTQDNDTTIGPKVGWEF